MCYKNYKNRKKINLEELFLKNVLLPNNKVYELFSEMQGLGG